MSYQGKPSSEWDGLTLAETINKAWIAAYPESSPVTEDAALRLRVRQLAEDRKCWMGNAKENNRELVRIDKKVTSLITV